MSIHRLKSPEINVPEGIRIIERHSILFDKENSKLLLLSREYTSYDNGYTVRIPIEWNGKVALSLKENSFTLFEWNPDENKVGKMIFKISTVVKFFM
mgnify:CR=1 FL=1